MPGPRGPSAYILGQMPVQLLPYACLGGEGFGEGERKKKDGRDSGGARCLSWPILLQRSTIGVKMVVYGIIASHINATGRADYAPDSEGGWVASRTPD